jgi:hypothetical protein
MAGEWNGTSKRFSEFVQAEYGFLRSGYIKTRNYEPDLASEWDHGEMLQNEVSFGTASPFLYLFTLLAVAVISGMILVIYKKIMR